MASSSRRFYWLKLPADFFERFDIRYMITQPDGDKAVVIYLKLLLRAITTDGKIDTSGGGESMAENLALLLGEEQQIMEKTLSMLQNFKLAESPEPGKLYLRELKKMVGTETGAAERMRKMRQRKKEEKQQKESTEESSRAGPLQQKETIPCSPLLRLSYDSVTDSYTEKRR